MRWPSCFVSRFFGITPKDTDMAMADITILRRSNQLTGIVDIATISVK
jgi:hypothetical protein